jgi:simple sugar transport system ATP-binding protein
LAFDARLIVMDEPTASLSVAKVEKLLQVTKRLKELGIAVIIITHRLDEAFAVSDRIAVMRQGEVVGRFGATEATEAEVTHLIAYGVPSASASDPRSGPSGGGARALTTAEATHASVATDRTPEGREL